MTTGKAELLRSTLQLGVGAAVSVEEFTAGPRSGWRAHFTDLRSLNGPTCTITPYGLKRYKVRLAFGDYAGSCIRQIMMAGEEQVISARALLNRIPLTYSLSITAGQDRTNWLVTDGLFSVDVAGNAVSNHGTEAAIAAVANEVAVPLLASMAELIGYDEVGTSVDEGIVEGDATETTYLRRERSRRNRFLCMSIHGNRCIACGFDPVSTYGAPGNIIEIHHIEPLSALDVPRVYCPETDLIPLCPNGHRIVHTRRPFPYSLVELKAILQDA